MSASPKDSPELWFHTLATHYVEVQILFHLNQTGVVEQLAAAGPLDAGDLAGRLALDPRVLGALLDYVAGVDRLLRRDADGRYDLTDFGREVLARFGRQESGRTRYNLFDVRAGAYAPVWAGLEVLLRGGAYGRDVRRAGDLAADAVYKLVVRLEPALRDALRRARAASVLELGVSTGLLERLGADGSAVVLQGVDRSPEVLACAAARAIAAGAPALHAIEGDVLTPERWVDRLEPSPPGVVFSVHFHEFIAAEDGPARLSRALATLGGALPGWTVVAFEQPRPTPDERAHAPDSEWLYAQSNVLIHHLIGNGRILTEGDWRALFDAAGLRDVRCQRVGYLGYRAFTGTFPGTPSGARS